jgi:hypothetical protein
MATTTYNNQSVTLARARVDWGAIWAGVFSFITIWSVFGMLGTAIFVSAANPNTPRPVTSSGMSWGMSIWAIVLTIIAMYVAGRITGRLAAVDTLHDGITHAMAMFGLSVVAAMVMIVLAGDSLSSAGTQASVHSTYILDVLSGLGWAGFFSLFLGWLAALGGASTGANRKGQIQAPVEPIRRAA